MESANLTRQRSLAVCLAAAFLLCSAAHAQVTRCTDAAGKVTYSDSGCANTATKSTQVLSREQVESNGANAQAAQRERDLQREAARDSDLATGRPLRPTQEPRQEQGGGGPIVFGHDPNERIRAQEERNMARRKAESDAAERARREQDERERNAPLIVNSCDRFGCQTNKGYAPRTDGAMRR